MTDRSARVVEVLGYIGANVRRLRLSRGFTQEQLAEASELDLRFLQRVERGQTNVGVAVVVALADALGVPPAKLFRKATLPEAKPGRPRKTARSQGGSNRSS
ncbi:helix-turn-helix transcriptional regulator [Polyangium sp. 15x6]|uniref:helix-turn-helix domain-containing protein n=1 Tax=Polyangium sp. 15x6 TaxID=3042687 RepID=UPI00249CABDB|nr:helix-turn-helix transcriptional regulator [Polyangium sp. 15x6]MDI3284945.1 helix-turn-helix transcriptional regulator [Polyangium sp. 15x6]